MPRGAKRGARGGSGRGGGGGGAGGPPPAGPAIDKGRAGHPRKKFYRARAHANPLSDGFFVDLPDAPTDADWASLYPEAAAAAAREGRALGTPSIVDVGCGFGGLLVQLAPHHPDALLVGIELRDSVCDYVRQRVAALRRGSPPRCENVAALRVNAQRHLTHLFAGGSLEKLFFLFPDPHFKAKNFRRRIVTPALASEYAYLLRPGGRLYTATDVPALAAWMAASLDGHPLFRRLTQEECDADPAVGLLTKATEEGQKVARNGGGAWTHCYERV